MTDSLNTNLGRNFFFFLQPDRAQETEETLNLNKIFNFTENFENFQIQMENIEKCQFSCQTPNDYSGASFGSSSNSFLSFEKE